MSEQRLRIVRLVAENIKKLRAVEITPSGEVVTIAGRNDQGKTTILDCIWMALDHTRVPAVMPIRKGQNKARIQLDMGELIVERRFTEKGSSLFVENAKGARFPSPQKILDALIGELSFDPLEFARMTPREQFDELRSVVKLDVDIEEMDRLNAGDFGKRTDLNRDAKAKRAQAEAIPVASGLPDQPIDERELLDRMERATAENTQIEQRRVRREQAAHTVKEARALVDAKRQEAIDLRARADEIDKAALAMASTADATQKQLDEAEPLPALVDVADIRVRLEHAKQVNAKLELRGRKAALLAEADIIEGRSDTLTQQMEARRKEKDAAIAGAKMPVEGLGFGDGDAAFITYQGIPFDQASTSVKLKVSLAIAMAANPTLRVIRIQDASLLDADSLKEIAAMAKLHDYQLWIEVVDTSGKIGVVIEDGAVVAVDGQPVEKATEAAA